MQTYPLAQPRGVQLDHPVGREAGAVEARLDLLQSKPQGAQRDDPLQAQHVFGGVEPVPAPRPARRREQPDLLVVVQRAHRKTRPIRQLPHLPRARSVYYPSPVSVHEDKDTTSRRVRFKGQSELF